MRSNGKLIYLETGDERWLDPAYSRLHSRAYLRARWEHLKGGRRRNQYSAPGLPERDQLFSYLRGVFSGSRKNAAQRALSFTLTETELMFLYVRAGGKCEVTGIPFSLERCASTRAPFAPSIDRIDNKIGYTLQNTRLTCQIANLAMNVWGADVLHDFIRLAAARQPSDQLQTSATTSAGQDQALAGSPADTPRAQESPGGSVAHAA